MTFFPQEDSAELAVLRSKLSPFLKAVSKALSAELEDGYLKPGQRKALFDEILENVPVENSSSNSFASWARALKSEVRNILDFEFDQLLDLQ